MSLRSKPGRRRSAAEWAQLVNTWQASGRELRDFATSRGVVPERLSWWKWRLGTQAARAASPPEKLRLVPVQVEHAPAADALPAWEVATADGQVLRVYRGITPNELAAVLAAIQPRRGRR